MDLRSLFKKNTYIEVKPNPEDRKFKPHIPDGMWVRCNNCGKTIYREEVQSNLKVCYSCGEYFRVGAWERIEQIADEGSFVEFFQEINSGNPLDFPNYDKKLKEAKLKSKLKEAVVSGECTIDGNKTVLCVMSSDFMMGSMGSVVGEKITSSVEYATKNRLPIIIFSCSGGARMQEGIFSLMQMVKTSAALARHDESGLLYISVLTDPTTGGVTASFAMLGDIILAEPNAVIGFAGRRVIEQTIKEDLPKEFQKSEFLQQCGFIDKIVPRKDMKKTLSTILMYHSEI